VGRESRKRNQRANRIFQSISYYILYQFFPFDTGEADCRLADALAQEFGEALMKKFEKWLEAKAEAEGERRGEQEKFLLKLVDFFDESDHFSRFFFDDQIFPRNLENSWYLVLLQESSRENTAITMLLKKLSWTLDSNYLEGLCKGETTRVMGLQILAANMVQAVKDKFQYWCFGNAKSVKDYYNFWEMTLQVFSEAYSDLRMLELLNVQDSLVYVRILDGNSLMERISYQPYLRCRAVCRALNLPPNIGDRYKPSEQLGVAVQLPLENLEQQVVGYLMECKQENQQYSIKGTWLQELIRQFRSFEPHFAISIVRDSLLHYREQLRYYFSKIKSDDTVT